MTLPPQAAGDATVRIIALTDLTPEDLANWTDAATNSAQPNVFAQPWMVLAAISALDLAHAARLAMVHSHDGTLIGAMPMTNGQLAGRIRLSAVLDWTHANAFVSALAIRCGHEQQFWQALLPALFRHAPRSRCVAISAIATNSAAYAGLVAAARERAVPLAIDRRTVRAMFARESEVEAYWRETVRPKKRKELRRQWNRINDLGEVSLDVLTRNADVTPWIDEFLELEASGWKGTAGSALASQPGTQTFFRDAMIAAQQHQAMCFIALRIDGRAVAMLITLIDRDAGFAFKTAYDEQLSSLSPGVLLQREALDIFSGLNLAWIDSCAAQDHPMIDSLWRERREIVQLSLPMPGMINRLIFAATQFATASWHRIKAIALATTAAAEMGATNA